MYFYSCSIKYIYLFCLKCYSLSKSMPDLEGFIVFTSIGIDQTQLFLHKIYSRLVVAKNVEEGVGYYLSVTTWVKKSKSSLT